MQITTIIWQFSHILIFPHTSFKPPWDLNNFRHEERVKFRLFVCSLAPLHGHGWNWLVPKSIKGPFKRTFLKEKCPNTIQTCGMLAQNVISGETPWIMTPRIPPGGPPSPGQTGRTPTWEECARKNSFGTEGNFDLKTSRKKLKSSRVSSGVLPQPTRWDPTTHQPMGFRIPIHPQLPSALWSRGNGWPPAPPTPTKTVLAQ